MATGPLKLNPAKQTALFGSSTPTSSMLGSMTPQDFPSPGRAAIVPPSPSPTPSSSPLAMNTPALLTRSSLPPSPTPTFILSCALKRKLPLLVPPPSFVAETGSYRGRETSTLSRGQARGPLMSTPMSLTRTPESWKPRLLVNSVGHKTTAPTKAQLREAAARERCEQNTESCASSVCWSSARPRCGNEGPSRHLL